MSPTPADTMLAIAIVLRWLAVGVASAAVTWVVLDLHSIATDTRAIAHDLKFMRATYEGRKAACEEMKP